MKGTRPSMLIEIVQEGYLNSNVFLEFKRSHNNERRKRVGRQQVWDF